MHAVRAQRLFSACSAAGSLRTPRFEILRSPRTHKTMNRRLSRRTAPSTQRV